MSRVLTFYCSKWFIFTLFVLIVITTELEIGLKKIGLDKTFPTISFEVRQLEPASFFSFKNPYTPDEPSNFAIIIT